VTFIANSTNTIDPATEVPRSAVAIKNMTKKKAGTSQTMINPMAEL
jgi:hypothetical protein